MNSAELIVWVLCIYGAIGLAVSVPFLLVGIDRIDASAHKSFAFRPILIPGIVVLWPFVLVRWYKLETKACSCVAGTDAKTLS